MLEPGPLRLAKGYIMHKMYTLRYIGGKHTALENLRKGCIPELRIHIADAVKELRREGLLVIHHTSYGEQASAIASPRGYSYANNYEKHYELPLLGERIPTPEVEPLSKEELRRLKWKRKKA